MSPIILFAILQVMDAFTTMAFLAAGVQEANPLIVLLMRLFDSSALGLAAIKAGALALGVFCWNRGRSTLLTRVNMAFGGLVAWNLVAIVIATKG